MRPVQPDQEGGSAEEVQGDVGDPEQRREGRDPVSRLLNRSLAEEVQMALERDDPVRVLAGHTKTRVTLATHDLVEAVETDDRGDLHQSSVGGGREAPEGRETVEGRHVHGSKLRPLARLDSTASPTRRPGLTPVFRGLIGSRRRVLRARFRPADPGDPRRRRLA